MNEAGSCRRASRLSPMKAASRRPVVSVLLSLFVFAIAGMSISARAATIIPSRSGGSWDVLFDLAPGATYTYSLEHGPANDRSHFGGRRPPTTGELNFSRIGWKDEIRFWFDVEGVRVNGTAPADMRALAGSVLLAALTGPEPLSADGVRLLAAAFQWTQWYDLFATTTFRNGLVWQLSQHPPYRFTATPRPGRRSYWGELTRGRDVVLELGIDLNAPLPWEIVAYDGRDYYKATLVQESGPGLRR